MDPSALRQLLAVLREGGATSATFECDGTLRSVTLGSAAPSVVETAGAKQAVFQDDSDELPAGAYDPVAKAKREGK